MNTKHMVEHQIKGRGIRDPQVLKAMEKVPRHLFVGEKEFSFAYTDGPLPIGSGQTISQPYIVAYMTEKLEIQPDDKVLEIGTGSGYQAAILSEITSNVYSIEFIRELAEQAKNNLAQAGYYNVTLTSGDGNEGWEEYAPFDKIIVTAAAKEIPPKLIEQLEVSGKMIIPVGQVNSIQDLILVEKNEDGTIQQSKLISVRFVPLKTET